VLATHVQKFKVSGLSVPKMEWKQMDGQADGGDRITSHASAVGKDDLIKRLNECKDNMEKRSMRSGVHMNKTKVMVSGELQCISILLSFFSGKHGSI